MPKEHEYSDDEIMENLKVWGETVEDDERNTVLIRKTLLLLPKDIWVKVIDEVVFLHTLARGTIFKMYFPEEGEQKFIMLNFVGVNDVQDKMNIIAHEIAHFALGHETFGPASEEKDADDLTEKWGFKRAYENYEE